MRNNQFIEGLEERRLMSVTGATLFPTTAGAQWKQETLYAGKLSSTMTSKVVGKTTINKISATELDSTITGSYGTSTVKGYFGLDSSKNVELYENVATSKYGATTYTITDTFSPEDVLFPAVMNPSVVYKYTWVNTNTTVTTPGGAKQTSTSTSKYTFDLTSSTPKSITVPAGTYKAYLVDETLTATVAGHTSVTPEQAWVVPGVGIVKLVTGTGATAYTTEMTKFKA